MVSGLKARLWHRLVQFLVKDPQLNDSIAPTCDFDRLGYEIRPCDIMLIEGRSRISNVIKGISQSPWTHSALYVGRLYDIEDPMLRKKVQEHWTGDPNDQLIIEALLGEGTVVNPLSNYKNEHVRTCRAKGLSPADSQKVIGYAINALGTDYDVRQLLDLARFMFPYGLLPPRWRSSLFSHNTGKPTQMVCSTMMAEAFHAVDFPILPFAEKIEDGKIRLYKRNPRLYTPKDFDYSPYFDIIKYPFFGLDDLTIYRRLPWDSQHMYYNDAKDGELPEKSKFEDQEMIDNGVKASADGGKTPSMEAIDKQDINLATALPKVKSEGS